MSVAAGARGPLEEYSNRLREHESRVSHYERLHIRIGNIRLLLAFAAGLLLWLSVRHHFLSLWWLTIPVALFAILVPFHSRVLRARTRAERAATVYRKGIERILDRWNGSGQTGERFAESAHVYANDLDLFGRGSMFELLSTARTHMGENTLARWLLSPADTDTIRARHLSISELSEKLDLREDLAVLGDVSRIGVHPEALLEWAEERQQIPEWLRFLASLSAAGAIITACLWGVTGLATPFVFVVAAEGCTAYWLRKWIRSVVDGTEQAFEDLDLFSAVLLRLERENFVAFPLRDLKTSLLSHNIPGSQAIGHLRTIMQFIDSRHNQIVRLLDVPMMYSAQVALAAERWRKSHGAAVRAWLRAIGEFEALISVAAYSYEHPDDPFPEFSAEEACFCSEELGHPLIPAKNCVRNNVRICGDARVLLVSGSNMSGKSTLLRAVGINAVLAMAGAPVRARRLRLKPVQVGASIRINDSLQEGSSRFYSEITRLRTLLDLTGQNLTLLFLLDELLQGTNSADRRIGAEGIVRGFLKRGAIGIISTHDLALTDLGTSLRAHIRNMHFQDDLENGIMRFDYTLRDGIVTKSNGVELMRSVGLEV